MLATKTASKKAYYTSDSEQLFRVPIRWGQMLWVFQTDVSNNLQVLKLAQMWSKLTRWQSKGREITVYTGGPGRYHLWKKRCSRKMVLKIMLTRDFIWSNKATYIEKLIYCIIYEQGFGTFFVLFFLESISQRCNQHTLKKGYRLRMASRADVVSETKETFNFSRLTVPRLCDPR